MPELHLSEGLMYNRLIADIDNRKAKEEAIRRLRRGAYDENIMKIYGKCGIDEPISALR